MTQNPRTLILLVLTLLRWTFASKSIVKTTYKNVVYYGYVTPCCDKAAGGSGEYLEADMKESYLNLAKNEPRNTENHPREIRFKGLKSVDLQHSALALALDKGAEINFDPKNCNWKPILIVNVINMYGGDKAGLAYITPKEVLIDIMIMNNASGPIKLRSTTQQKGKLFKYLTASDNDPVLSDLIGWSGPVMLEWEFLPKFELQSCFGEVAQIHLFVRKQTKNKKAKWSRLIGSGKFIGTGKKVIGTVFRDEAFFWIQVEETKSKLLLRATVDEINRIITVQNTQSCQECFPEKSAKLLLSTNKIDWKKILVEEYSKHKFGINRLFLDFTPDFWLCCSLRKPTVEKEFTVIPYDYIV